MYASALATDRLRGPNLQPTTVPAGSRNPVSHATESATVRPGWIKPHTETSDTTVVADSAPIALTTVPSKVAEEAKIASETLKQYHRIEITNRFPRFIVTQKWEGYVTEIKGSYIKAVVADLTNPANPREEIGFDVDEVSDADRPLVQEGAIFYWHIGYQDDANGQRTRASSFRFRRLPAWTKRDITRAEKSADDLFRLLSEG